jgi:hypothetical protein
MSDAWEQAMERAEQLRQALEAIAASTAVTPTTSAPVDARQIAEELERLYKNGGRNYSWMGRK